MGAHALQELGGRAQTSSRAQTSPPQGRQLGFSEPTFPEALPPAPTLGGMSSQHFSAVCGSQGKPSAMEHRTGMGKEPPAPRC